MKALTIREYGSPDFLEIRDVERPTPGGDEVLIKVQAASINDWDWGLLHGKPLIPNRLMAGLFRPRIIIGCDVAGVIEAVGNGVNKYKPGDDVYGDLSGCGFGGFAEYVCASQDAVHFKPPDMSFEQAAAIPHAGMLALQALMAGSEDKSDQSILINGAGGGVGSIAIQLLKRHDVDVTGVDSAEKLEAMRSWGFDHTVDYRAHDFTRLDQRFDLVVDVNTDRSPADYERALNPGGVYATVGGKPLKLLRIATSGLRVTRDPSKELKVIGLRANRDLAYFNDIFDAGQFEPTIDSEFEFTNSDVRTAFHHFGAAAHKGKIVVRIEQAASR